MGISEATVGVSYFRVNSFKMGIIGKIWVMYKLRINDKTNRKKISVISYLDTNYIVTCIETKRFIFE